MRRYQYIPLLRLVVFALSLLVFSNHSHAEPKLAESLDIAPVWAGHPVGFSLLTDGDRQYVAYYDAERQMTIASRTLGSKTWKYQVLPSRVGWDSHNSITMALDRKGHLHLSGNMHCVPLIYFRSEKPHDITTLKRMGGMVGRNETRCTYPQFFKNPDGELVFVHRDGGSGNGCRLWNIYDADKQAWSRLLEQPLLDGKGLMNAYPSGPKLLGDGFYHLCWMWRDTPDCKTNHHISYARSRDLVHWETAGGTPLALPITLETKGVIVDPTPTRRGLINVSFGVALDAENRPIIHYHNYDANGKSQIYNARFEKDHWKIYQTSDWDYRWEFGGGGCILVDITSSPVRLLEDGSLAQGYRNAKHGSGIWRLDSKTFKPIGTARSEFPMPRMLGQMESDFAGMGKKRASDRGDSGDPKVRYILQWETLPANRDRPRSGPLPGPSMLRLHKIVQE